MKPLTILRLDLYAPLLYIRDMGLNPFEGADLREETLFCFEINPDQSLSIEPEEDHYLGALLWGGRLDPQPSPSKTPAGLELPAGHYLFAQAREILNQGECIWMAAEVQKEGLWERLSLEQGLYFRYLFEDGKGVTQVFRPYKV